MSIVFEALSDNVKVNALGTDNVKANVLDIEKVKQDVLGAPLKNGGSYGPISWDADFHFDHSDITKSSAAIKITVLGVSIVDGRLDANHPNLSVDLTVTHVGVKADIGIDFNARRIYFKGYLNFVFYKTNYDFTILSF
jgi:hypothetical protein